MNPLILQLLPLATQFVVPLMERLIGAKKTPTDTTTGDTKLNGAITVLQQAVGALQGSGVLPAGTPATDELKGIVDLAVTILKPLGLDAMSKTNVLASAPMMAAGTYPIVLSGSVQIGSAK